MAAMPDHQEVMGAIADMVIDGFAMDCCLARTKKLVETQGEDASKIAIAMTQLYIADAITRIESAAKKVLADVAEGDMLRTQMSIVRRLTKHDPYNLIALQEKVAARTIEQGKFVTV